MQKRDIVKKTVTTLTQFGIGTVTKNIIAGNMPRHPNPVIDFALGASTLVTAYAVSAVVSEKVTPHLEEQIDALADAIDTTQN